MRTNFDGQLGREYDAENRAARMNQTHYPPAIDSLMRRRTEALRSLFRVCLPSLVGAWREVGYQLPFSCQLELVEMHRSMGIHSATVAINPSGEGWYAVLNSQQDSTWVMDYDSGNYTSSIDKAVSE